MPVRYCSTIFVQLFVQLLQRNPNSTFARDTLFFACCAIHARKLWVVAYTQINMASMNRSKKILFSFFFFFKWKKVRPTGGLETKFLPVGFENSQGNKFRRRGNNCEVEILSPGHDGLIHSNSVLYESYYNKCVCVCCYKLAYFLCCFFPSLKRNVS